MKLSSDANHRVRGYGLYVQDQLSLGDWHLLGGLRRDAFTVTSRRNDLDKEETLSVTSLSPVWAWCGTPSRSTPSTPPTARPSPRSAVS